MWEGKTRRLALALSFSLPSGRLLFWAPEEISSSHLSARSYPCIYYILLFLQVFFSPIFSWVYKSQPHKLVLIVEEKSSGEMHNIFCRGKICWDVFHNIISHPFAGEHQSSLSDLSLSVCQAYILNPTFTCMSNRYLCSANPQWMDSPPLISHVLSPHITLIVILTSSIHSLWNPIFILLANSTNSVFEMSDKSILSFQFPFSLSCIGSLQDPTFLSLVFSLPLLSDSVSISPLHCPLGAIKECVYWGWGGAIVVYHC